MIVERATRGEERATLILGHGAGAHMRHASMEALSGELRAHGLCVVRFDFPYRVNGKGRPDPMPRLMESYRETIEQVRERVAPERLILGGRSMGGRTASMLAAEGLACDGLLLLAYPLHPPGRTDKLRDEHLGRITVPTLCFNGTRDSFCTPELMDALGERLPETWTMHWLEGADHGFKVLKRSGRTPEDVVQEIGVRTSQWLDEL